MSKLALCLPVEELGIIWRYFDGVSQALARRFGRGSSPAEENLTFLLCELLDEGTTSLHLLDYPLSKAKEDLAKADGGFSLDVSYQTHEHTKHVEHHFSGADLGVIFVVDHTYFGRSEKGVLLQAKRLFPSGSQGFTMNSSFSSFHLTQLNMLKTIEERFTAHNSIFYLWYAPASNSFPDGDAKIIRALEATTAGQMACVERLASIFDKMIESGWSWHGRQSVTSKFALETFDWMRDWRIQQPTARISSLPFVDRLTAGGSAPRLVGLYQARSVWKKKHTFVYEPLAELFLFGLLSSAIGNSSIEWLRLARGDKVEMPTTNNSAQSKSPPPLAPDIVPPPKHSITISSSLIWPDGLHPID